MAQADVTLAWLALGQNMKEVRAKLAGRMVGDPPVKPAARLPLVPRPDLNASSPEPELLAGRTVLVAMRNGERSEAVGDWLHYHARDYGVDGALIFDRSKGGDAAFCAGLKTEFPVLVVSAEYPAGQPHGSDLRVPSMAPAAPKRSAAPPSDWHGALMQTGLFDLLRYLFLSEARAVAFLNIADLLLPLSKGETVFERAVSAPDKAVMLLGVEAYPWRLRQGAPAPHSDHIATRRTERRGVRSWAIAPQSLSWETLWQPGAPVGVPAFDAEPAPFVRAMGVVYPGAPVNTIVRKADLREEPGLLDVMQRSFQADPLRLPAPSAIPPRRASNRLTLVTAMKNEGPYILDWVAHNRALGVTDILAYTNDCEDGTDQLLSLLREAGVSHRDNPYRTSGKVPQYAAFRAAEQEPAVENADWLMTLDVDEYLNIHAGDGMLSDLLEAVPQAHALSIPWRMFGNADLATFNDRPVVEQFTRCAPEYAPRPLQAWAFKTLYRNEGLFRRLGVHRPKGLVRGFRDTLVWVDATGTRLPPIVWDKAWRMSKAQWGYTYATLNHYAVRSAESFLVKRERGKVNRTKREQGLAYWFRMNHNAEEDRSILRFAARVAKEKASLLSLPGVPAAHERAVEWHQARIAKLRARPDYASLFEEITTPRMQHLSRNATNFGANVHLLGPQVIPDDVAARDPSEPFYWTVKIAGR
ncbi:MAG: glycosyltransferase family 2 protein [Pseudomonadota bacterium]